jgi:hypothetical protein
VGSLPSELQTLTSLQNFSIYNNSVAGTIPPTIYTSWLNLSLFDVERNQLSGPAVPKNATLFGPQLASYRVSENELSGIVSTAWVQSPSALRELWMAHNLLSGSLPSEIGAFSNLGKFCTSALFDLVLA